MTKYTVEENLNWAAKRFNKSEDEIVRAYDGNITAIHNDVSRLRKGCEGTRTGLGVGGAASLSLMASTVFAVSVGQEEGEAQNASAQAYAEEVQPHWELGIPESAREHGVSGMMVSGVFMVVAMAMTLKSIVAVTKTNHSIRKLLPVKSNRRPVVS